MSVVNEFRDMANISAYFAAELGAPLWGQGLRGRRDPVARRRQLGQQELRTEAQWANRQGWVARAKR